MVMNFALYDTNLHMIHHYKRVNSAKSVVNTSAPKTLNRKYVSSLNSRYSTPTLLSASSKNPSRANSNCEVRRKRINCLKNEAASSERSCSVPPRPGTRRNASSIPLNYLTIDNSFPKINENRQKITKNEASVSGYTTKKKATNYNSGSSSSSAKSSPKHAKGKLIDSTKNTVKRPVPTPRVIVPEHKHISPEDYEYVQFSLRITEDIIKNDLYSQKEMRRVFNSHVEANRGRLNMRKMLLQIDHLATELNFSKKSLDRVSKLTSTDNMVSVNTKEELMLKIHSGHILTEEEIYGLNDEDLEEVLNTIINSCKCDHTRSEKAEVDIEVLKFKEICNCESEEMFKNISTSSSHDSYTPLQAENNVKNFPVQELYRYKEINNSESNSKQYFIITQENIESCRESAISASNCEPDVIKANIKDFEKEIIEKCERCKKRLQQLINQNKENVGKILSNCDSCKLILSQKNSNKENMPQEINENIQEIEQIQNMNTENIEVKESDSTVSSKSKESLSQIAEKENDENIQETESNTKIEEPVISEHTILELAESYKEVQQQESRSKHDITEQQVSKSKDSIVKSEQTEKSKSNENVEITEPDNNIPIDLERKSSTNSGEQNILSITKLEKPVTSTEPVLELKENSEELQKQQRQYIVDIVDSIPQISKSEDWESISEHTVKSKSIENIEATEQENIPIEPERISSKEDESKSVSVEIISALIQQLKEKSVDSIQEILQIKKSQDSIPKNGSNGIFQQTDIEKDASKEESQKSKTTLEPEEKCEICDKTVSKETVQSETKQGSMDNIQENLQIEKRSQGSFQTIPKNVSNGVFQQTDIEKDASKDESQKSKTTLLETKQERSADRIQEKLRIEKRSQGSIHTIPKNGSNGTFQQTDIEKDASKEESQKSKTTLIETKQKRSADSIQEKLRIEKRSQGSIHTIPKNGSNGTFQQTDIEKDASKEESQKSKSTLETKSFEPQEKCEICDKTVSKETVQSEDICLDVEELKPKANNLYFFDSNSVKSAKMEEKISIPSLVENASVPSEDICLDVEELKPKPNDLYFFDSNSVKSAKMEEKVSIRLEKYSLENTDDNVSRNELISSITKFILDRTFSKVSQEESITEEEIKSDFISVIEKAVSDQTKNLYDYYIPEKKISSTSDFAGKVSLESLDKYQTNKTEYQKRETKRRKSSSSPSVTISQTSSVSSFTNKVPQKPIKKLSKQSNILDHLEKYEQREETPKNVLKPCLCDYEMIKPYSGKLYENYVPKYSRSRFFPTVGTQTSNNNLLSDGEVDCFSSDGRTDNMSERSSF